jgi:hypothetical protein
MGIFEGMFINVRSPVVRNCFDPNLAEIKMGTAIFSLNNETSLLFKS